ncbi:uncharacterized protein PAN0_017d5518 [Moesziomyces antarcticus]|uniref:Uncharacterized protein n=2 Tax=Pseudozyma antarctica TaxID=84753 RepID=A0A081CKU5_PSEA2|nr:uncharacterized protein PAN0_017d5518 [Moesziomyces antarcticus]GAK67291.1 hypothetical protein PAN0_017d5518 [Moesziomyces antarcticus]SPO48097.1 uncharacterized protein PSANT_05785 [Moesziomyces antarcticus]
MTSRLLPRLVSLLSALTLLCLCGEAVAPGSEGAVPRRQLRAPADLAGRRALRRYLEITDDASSAPNLALYPGTHVPMDVMTHLLGEQYSVDHHVPINIIGGQERTFYGKVRELLLHPRTPVTSMGYEGNTFFITQARRLDESNYPAWGTMIRPAFQLHDDALHPILIGKVLQNNPQGYEFDLLAVRSPATVTEREKFLARLESSRRLVHFTDLL